MAEMDVIGLLAGIALVVGFAIGALIMLWSNPYWKMKMLRRFMKKNYIMLRFLTKNRRGFERIAVANVDDDIILWQNKAIIFDKGRIWRTDASNILGRDDKDIIIKAGTQKNEAFDFYTRDVRDMLKMELDVPVLYVDEDRFMPIDPFLEGQAPASEVTSSWLNSALNNHISIGIRKKLMSNKMELKDILMMCGMVICVYLVYSQGGSIDKISQNVQANHDSIGALDNKVTVIGNTVNALPRNQTIVYSQR